MQNKRAFTLAEVLITLGIIGVIAALTIPSLINKIQDEQYKTAYKKAYSVFSQAVLKGYSENNMTSYTDVSGKLANFNAFKSYFKVVKECNTSNSDCWSTNGDKYVTSYPSSDALAFIDSSGMAWSLVDNSLSTGRYLVDTNGFKGPNKYGQDRFPFTYDSTTGKTTVFNCDFLSITDVCTSAGETAADFCPSASSHPCYYQSWIIGGN